MASLAIDETYVLADRYARRSGRVFLSGVQALVRLPLLQARRDRDLGLRTAGFISGYRGSPLAGYDSALWAAKASLQEAGVVFEPGLNEELAATAVWGSQQVALRPDATTDGVFAIWYGKGPGVDRAMDAIKHANAAGTAPLGGVLAVFGDDHGAQSSTLLHQSEPMFEAAGVPVLNPSDVEEHVIFGLHGFALSRYAGCWVGLKATTEVVEASASIAADPPAVPTVPTDFDIPVGGLGIRYPDTAVEQERRLLGSRLEAVATFARANSLDRQELTGDGARLGVATTGKAYNDLRQAMLVLGIGPGEAQALGLRLYKIGMSWPLEAEGARRFASGLTEVLVVEEKRAFLEPQLLSALRFMPDPPRVTGKADEQGAPLLPSIGELTPLVVARALVQRLRALGADVAHLEPRLEAMVRASAPVSAGPLVRTPFFCSGCPHNTSTKVPDGSRALAGTGCHSMSMYIPDRNAAFLTQMGGEGVNWIGQAPFVDEGHVFVNLGDGTFSHSGLLALRAAIAAGVNATYKILFNDAVAMTGGQENDAHLSVARVAHQVRAEGARRVVVLAEDPGRHDPAAFPADVEILARAELNRIQTELRLVEGVTVIVYDQVCAAEKRRRRKRGDYAPPSKRVVINAAVCEACGDCSAASNCISVAPVETPLGRKRAIEQSSCNADYSCVQGFCPSFVTVEGAKPRKVTADAAELDRALADLPEPEPRPLSGGACNILATGIGGTGVITVGALIAMAAHLEGRAVTTLDFTGLAQKNGAVVSHIRIAADARELGPVRVDAGEADLVLACDVVVAASAATLSRMGSGRTRVIANTHVQPPGAFVLDTRIDLSAQPSLAAVERATGASAETLEATRLASTIFGDSIFANLMVLGFAWQKGLTPVGLAAMQRAIVLNGAAVPANLKAFACGRLAAERPAVLDRLFAAPPRPPPLSANEVVADRRARLVAYQDEAYAHRFDALLAEVAAAERRVGLHDGPLTAAVARNLYKLMAYKDEYEVARLYTDGTFEADLQAQLEGGGRREIYLAPPLFARRDPVTGRQLKQAFGPWVFTAFRLLARLRRLRGTPFDPFGRTQERRLERALIAQYIADVRDALPTLDAGRLQRLLALAELPDAIRGFGHVKERNLDAAERTRTELLSEIHVRPPPLVSVSAKREREVVA